MIGYQSHLTPIQHCDTFGRKSFNTPNLVFVVAIVLTQRGTAWDFASRICAGFNGRGTQKSLQRHVALLMLFEPQRSQTNMHLVVFSNSFFDIALSTSDKWGNNAPLRTKDELTHLVVGVTDEMEK
jgi:hypothetical protein